MLGRLETGRIKLQLWETRESFWSSYRTEGGCQAEDGRKWRRCNLSGAANGSDRCAAGLGKWLRLWRVAGVNQRKVDRSLIISKRWGGLDEAGFSHWEVWTGPSITPGRSADEAWAPASEERIQTARHRHAGRGEVGRGRWCGWLTAQCASHHYKSCHNRQ